MTRLGYLLDDEKFLKIWQENIDYVLAHPLPAKKGIDIETQKKMEQERISDEAEKNQGNPLPLRYRSMHSPEDSQTRIIEREYDSFEDLCRITENFFSESTPADQAVMDAECRRQNFFTWEREEIYIADTDSYTPDWMTE